jgi:integrase
MTRRIQGPRSLPVSEWPAADQRAWKDAIKPAMRLARGGGAGHLAADSREDIARRYGAYLGFLNRCGWLDCQAAAATLVTPEGVSAYVAELQGRVRSVTIYNCVHKLRRAVEILSGKTEFSWLAEIERDLKLVMVPRSKFSRVVFSDRLVEAGLGLIEKARALQNSVEQARMIRNGLMIAILAIYPIRLKNFVKLEKGKSFQWIEGAWWIILPARNTKSDRRDERRIRAFLTPYIEEYIRNARPVLLSAQSDALWVSSTTGAAFTKKNLGSLISKITKAAIGVDVSPHLFRTAAASTAASEGSDLPKLAAGVLGHVDSRITELHYNRARASDAAKSYAEILYAVRATRGN